VKPPRRVLCTPITAAQTQRRSAAPFRLFSCRMGGRWDVARARFCCVSCLAAILPPAPARAESATLSACRFQAVAIAKVRAITDGRSFILEDGREVRLAGIEIPLAPAQGESGAKAEAGLAARAALESMLNGQTVELHENGAAVDRYGRTIALAYVIDDRASHSVAHEMLARGFARVSVHVGGGRPLRGRALGARTGGAGGQAWPVERTVLCHRRGR